MQNVDGIKTVTVGGVRGRGVGRVVSGEVDGGLVASGSYVIAPFFSDFVGRTWESDYPSLLGRYYDVLLSDGRGGLRDFGQAGGCGGVGGVATEPFVLRRIDPATYVGRVEGDAGDATRDDEGHASLLGDAVGCGAGAVVEADGVVESVVECGASLPVGVVAASSACRGKNYERNKKKRDGKKSRAAFVRSGAGVSVGGSSVCVEAGSESRRTLEEKWVLQNKLAMVKLEKDIEVQRARDVQAEVKRDRVRLLRDTEKGKVEVEKAFSTLKATGNVAGVVPGFCETVVSEGSAGSVPSLSTGESISPDSSASMHEFRKVQKESLDKDAKIRELECQVRGLMFDRCERVAVTVANSEEDMDAKVEGLFRQFVTGKHDGIDYVGGDEGTLFVRKSVYIPAEGDEASLDDERFNYTTV